MINMLPYRILASTIYGKMGKSNIKTKTFKISAPTQNDKFQLLHGSYSISDIQDYFNYVIKEHETMTHNPPIRIYINKTENGITFKIKSEDCLQFLTPETMKRFGSAIQKLLK